MTSLYKLTTTDFDDINHEEENTSDETTSKEPMKVKSKKQKIKTRVKGKTLPDNNAEMSKFPLCIGRKERNQLTTLDNI